MPLRFLTLCVFSLALAASAAFAQSFPSGPVKLIVPYPPGGATDIIGRAIAQAMTESLGQPVVVDNRPGANGAVGSDVVAKSAPDGYTIGLGGSSTHVLNPLLYKLAYDPVKEFAPLGIVATTNFVILVNPQSPTRTLQDLLAWLRANPGKASYASFGNASAGHLAGELFKSMAGVDMVHVPYKGAAPAQTDLMAGHIALMFSDMSGMPHVQSGKLRALAMTGGKRSNSFPDIPTVAEAGVPGYEVVGAHSTLIFDSTMTLCHVSRSFCMRAASSRGAPGAGSSPRPTRRSRTSFAESALVSSRFNRSTIGPGVPAGA